MVVNPIVTLRGDLSRLAFCRKHGLSYCTLSYLEGGTQNLGGQMAEKLSRISGIDADKLKEDFFKWKHERHAA